jgi:hypothetical protein
MSVVTDLRVNNPFFVVLPKPLNASRTFLLVPQIITKGPLNASCHIVPIFVAHSFQSKKLDDLSNPDLHKSIFIPFQGS